MRRWIAALLLAALGLPLAAQPVSDEAMVALQEAYARAVKPGEEADLHVALFPLLFQRVQRSYAVEADLPGVAAAALKLLQPLPAGDEDAPESAFAALDLQASPLVGLSLLIVEDNPVNMMIAVALLQQWGVEVTEAANGAEAVARVAQQADAGRPFDLVLMDVQMPVQGGHDATRILRQRFAADDLPIIALTAAALTSERDDALAAGMNDFLTKPIDAQRLHDTLLRWAAGAARRRLRRSQAAARSAEGAPARPPATAS